MSLVKKIRRLTPAPLQEPVLSVVRAKRLRDARMIMTGGFPTFLVEPLRFLATKQVPAATAPIQAQVESLRQVLRGRTDALQFPRGARQMAEVAKTISIDGVFGTFLHLCASAIGAERILELGVGGGIGSCYLAMTPSCREYVGVDIAPQAIEVGRGHLRSCVDESRVRLLETTFDDALDQFRAAGEVFDFIWLDGDHYVEKTLRYTQKAAGILRPGGIIAFDDLRWSGGMLTAWQTLQTQPGFAHTLDVGRLGLAVRGVKSEMPRHWDFTRALFWPWSLPQDPSLLPPVGDNPTI